MERVKRLEIAHGANSMFGGSSRTKYPQVERFARLAGNSEQQGAEKELSFQEPCPACFKEQLMGVGEVGGWRPGDEFMRGEGEWGWLSLGCWGIQDSFN